MDKKLLKYINEWLYLNDKMRKINQILFNHTELYERKYTQDFEDSLFRFFAGKITRYTREENQIRKMLTPKQTELMHEIEIFERRI